jgi:hypothetical protein
MRRRWPGERRGLLRCLFGEEGGLLVDISEDVVVRLLLKMLSSVLF